MQTDEHLLTVLRYVERNPVRAGIVERAVDWRWSSLNTWRTPGHELSPLLSDWPPEKLEEARRSGSLLEASEVAEVVMFMLTRPRGMTIRDVVMLPTNFDL